jgi:hypothetical protein
MRPATHLTIPQPCSESWAAMTPTATGRHCAACANTVIDFTQLSDAEILEQLARPGNTCGRFRAGQLGRPLQPVALAPARGWRGWLAAGVAVWGLREVGSTSARAQAPIEQHPAQAPLPEELQIRRRDDYEGIRAAAVVLRGVVVDSATQEGLPGVSVILHGTTQGTASRADGTFELEIPPALAAHPNALVDFKYLGYKTQSAAVAEVVAVSGAFRVTMPVDTAELQGAVVVVGGIHAMDVPAPWHPRRLFYWSKYWLTRPFRSQ